MTKTYSANPADRPTASFPSLRRQLGQVATRKAALAELLSIASDPSPPPVPSASPPPS